MSKTKTKTPKKSVKKHDLRNVLATLRGDMERSALAEKMGVSYRYIWAAENEKAPTSIHTIQEYLDALGAKLEVNIIAKDKTVHSVAVA